MPLNIELRLEQAYEHFLSARRLIECLHEKVEYDSKLSYDEDNQALRSASTQMLETVRELDWIRGVLENRHFS